MPEGHLAAKSARKPFSLGINGIFLREKGACPPYMPPGTNYNRGAVAPDPPDKKALGLVNMRLGRWTAIGLI
jgi:hypothetical protein